MSPSGRALNQSGHVGDKSLGRENGVCGKSRDDVVAIGDGVLWRLDHCLLLSLLLLLLQGLKRKMKGWEKQVNVYKNNVDDLGMAILGGKDHNLPIIISEIFPNSALSRCSR